MTVRIPLRATIDRTVSGEKAANLAHLMGSGFPVPAGVVGPAANVELVRIGVDVVLGRP